MLYLVPLFLSFSFFFFGFLCSFVLAALPPTLPRPSRHLIRLLAAAGTEAHMEPVCYCRVLVLVAACKDEPSAGGDGDVPLTAGARRRFGATCFQLLCGNFAWEGEHAPDDSWGVLYPRPPRSPPSPLMASP